MAENVVGSAYDDCFVDRQDILDRLDSLADLVDREQRPRYAFIYGESGIGKTAIIRHFLALQESKRRDGQCVIRVECDDAKGPPLLPFVRGMSEFRGSRDIARTATRLIPDFVGCVLPGIGPSLKDAADAIMESRMSDMDRLMTGEDAMFRLCSQIVESASKRGLLIFSIDDAQWLDETAKSLLNHIVVTNTKTPVLFVIAARTPDGGQNRNLHYLDAMRRRVEDRSEFIEVEPFTMGSCAEMIRRFSGGRYGDRDIRKIYEATKGSPWWLRCTLRSGAARAQLPQAASQYLNAMLENAYSDLPESRRVLQYAAVLGFRFELTALSKLLGMEAGAVFDVLSGLCRHGLVENPEKGEYFKFAHRIARDHVYESIKSLHETYHADVAEFLEREDPGSQNHYLIAYHYLQTPHMDRALLHMKRAASASMTGNHFIDASKWLKQCVDTAEYLDLRKEEISAIRLDYARALLEENDAESSRNMLEELVGDRRLSRERRARAHTLLSRCHRLLGTAESGAEALSHARTAARMMEGGDPRQAGDACAYLATVCDHFGDDDSETKRAYREATKYYQGYPIELARLHRKCGMILESRQAIERMKRSLPVFRANRMNIETARCLNNIGAECLYVGRFEESYEHLSASLEKFRMLGTHETDIPLNNLGLLYLQKGEYRRAMQHFEDALARQSESYHEIAVTVNMSTVHRKEGRPQKAADALYGIEGPVMENAEPTLRDYYGFNRGAAHRDLGEWEAAREWLLRFPVNTYKNDQRLAWAKRERALSEICSMQGEPGPSPSDEAKIREIFGTRRPQRWFYEADYYPCDIHMWD